MTHTIQPSEVISVEDALTTIKKVLVLCPAYERPTIHTSELLSQIASLGSLFVIRCGVSDVATARCLIAADALEILQNRDYFDTVFWLDSDMTGSPHHIAALAQLSRLHNVAVVGHCCPRNDRNTIAAKLLAQPEISTDLDAIQLLPVYAGMACMAVPRQQFIDVANAAPSFKLAGCRRAPAICQSRLVHQFGHVDEQWLSEDMFYCRSLWSDARGVYYAPIEFGHVTLAPVFPTDDAQFIKTDAESDPDPAPTTSR